MRVGESRKSVGVLDGEEQPSCAMRRNQPLPSAHASIAAPRSWSRALSHSPRPEWSLLSNPVSAATASNQIAAPLERKVRSAGATPRKSSCRPRL